MNYEQAAPNKNLATSTKLPKPENPEESKQELKKELCLFQVDGECLSFYDYVRMETLQGQIEVIVDLDFIFAKTNTYTPIFEARL